MSGDQILEKVLAAASVSFNRTVNENDNFFSLGGDSLIAVLLAEELEGSIGSEIDINMILEAEDFGHLAGLLREDLEDRRSSSMNG